MPKAFESVVCGSESRRGRQRSKWGWHSCRPRRDPARCARSLSSGPNPTSPSLRSDLSCACISSTVQTYTGMCPTRHRGLGFRARIDWERIETDTRMKCGVSPIDFRPRSLMCVLSSNGFPYPARRPRAASDYGIPCHADSLGWASRVAPSPKSVGDLRCGGTDGPASHRPL
jgi:hypothetical protein